MVMLRFVALLALVAALTAPAALADSAPIPNDGSLPWSDPNHQTPVEVLGGKIASVIANRAVTVRCLNETDWSAELGRLGAPPDLAGVVGAQWHEDGSLAGIDSYTELSPNTCLALQRFAAASSKPTKCSPLVAHSTTTYKTVRVRATVRVRVNGKWQSRTVWRTRKVKTTIVRQIPGPLQPCYVNKKAPRAMPDAFWKSYSSSANAILTLAHESIHLAGAVGGVLANGLRVGDPQAEARAECSGMQWMPWVATQLGDSWDDGYAIAAYFYDVMYPGMQGAESNGLPYWSPDCVPGGALDIRPAGEPRWP